MQNPAMNCYQSFADVLQGEYLKRLRKNPHFSVRQYAVLLEMNDSTLAKLMKGQRKPGERLMLRLSEKLELANLDLSPFLGEGALDFGHRKVEDMAYHSDWHFDAILEMTYLDNLEFSAEAVSRTLDLSLDQAQQKIETLIGRGHLKQDTSGRWVDSLGFATTYLGASFESESLKNYQAGLHQRSASSVHASDITTKDHASYVTALDKDLIPEIKLILKRCRREIADLVESKSLKKDGIYAITTNLFSLDQGDLNDAEK